MTRITNLLIGLAATLAIFAAVACGSDTTTGPNRRISGVGSSDAPAFSLASASVRFGDKIDSFEGIDIYSNSSIGKPATAQMSAHGLKWECVEFCRRYTAMRYNATLPTVGVAVDFWNRSLPGLRRVSNSAVELPQVGDILIMSGGGAGHAAIVASVSSNSITIAQQNTVYSRQSLSVTSSVMGGTARYTVSALTNYTTLGWFTRRAAPTLRPSIVAHSPLTPRISTKTQKMGFITSGVGGDLMVYLYNPTGTRTTFQSGSYSLTPNGIVMSVLLSKLGNWSLQLQSGGHSSAKYQFTVVK